MGSHKNTTMNTTDDFQLHCQKEKESKIFAQAYHNTVIKLRAPAYHTHIESTTRDQSFPSHYSHLMMQTSLALPLLRKYLEIHFFPQGR